MPQHKSCEKRMRTSREARGRNHAYQAQVRNLIRNVRQAQDKPAAEENLKKAVSLLDRLSRRGIIHKNNAANYKSKLYQHVKSLPG